MRRTLLLLASMALAVVLGCGVAIVEAVRPAQAAFPGKNGKIVFVEDKEEGAADGLKLIRPDGSGLVTVLKRPYLSDPAMSPSGTRVAYAGGNNLYAEIYMLNISNGRVRQLTNNALKDSDPTWSPDGTRVAFVRRTYADEVDVETDIFVRRVDGTGTTVNVTDTQGENEYNPAWSPNGEEIAFSPGQDDIVVQNLATGQRRNLSTGSPKDFGPNWSPDGTRIVFQSVTYLGRPDCEWSTQINTMNASDGSDRRLLTTQACSDGTGNGFYVTRPAYSPDGKQIAFVKIRSDFADDIHRRQLMRMNASTGANKQPIYNVITARFYPLLSVPDWGVKVQR